MSDEDVESYKVGEDWILAIHIPRAQREVKPVYINNDLFGGTFRRNGEGDYHCIKSEVKAMIRDQAEDSSDMKVLEDFDIRDLNLETVHAYRNRHAAYCAEHVWEGLTDEEYLERIGAAKRVKTDKKPRPTAAGLLMFGEEYRILYEYPEYFLDYREMLDPYPLDRPPAVKLWRLKETAKLRVSLNILDSVQRTQEFFFQSLWMRVRFRYKAMGGHADMVCRVETRAKTIQYI